jgi:hypothetical protein
LAFFASPGIANAVEFLAAVQQCGIEGLHPGLRSTQPNRSIALAFLCVSDDATSIVILRPAPLPQAGRRISLSFLCAVRFSSLPLCVKSFDFRRHESHVFA